MFTDLVDSTSLATRLDPEDLREVISVIQRCITKAVTLFGGFPARYIGDGALIYFGYPTAHEDDAERAIRAALAAVEAVRHLNLPGGYRPQIRVGIATGLVVVGDIVGGLHRPEQDVAGETPNLAARLMAVAPPGSIVVSSGTRDLAAGLFEYRDLGLFQLKGFPLPLPAWQVLRASATESRFEAQRGAHLTPFTGRDAEMETLLRLWAAARAGAGQVALISGEAGIGKSRLAAALQERLQAESHLRLRYFCSPHGSTSPLFPVVNQIERAAGFERSDTPERRQAKLRKFLEFFAAAPDVEAPFVADLMSLAGPRGGASKGLTPPQCKERTLATLLAMIGSLATRQPLLLLIEDAHWIDPTSFELLGMLVERVARLRVLVVVTARPEFVADWTARSNVTTLPLTRLNPDEAAEMLDSLAHRNMSAAVKRSILDRTDGVPLFIEELTRTVLESELAQGAGHGDLSSRGQQAVIIPTTLQASLMARLDRLEGVRELAQTAAAIGREFSYDLLREIVDISPDALDSGLARLVAVDLVHSSGTTRERSYRFKHALVRDTAYESLLRARRKELHARIVAAMERSFTQRIELQPELVARHCMAAGLVEKAIAHWLKAGAQAQRRFAMAEATTALRQCLELLRTLPERPVRDQKELEILLALSRAVVATEGYAAPEAGKIFHEARHLCDRMGQPPELVSVLYGQWSHSVMRADLRAARHFSEELLTLGEARHDDAWTVRGCRLSGLTCLARGDFAAARQFLERGLELYDPEDRARHGAFTLYDPQIMMQVFLSWSLFDLGYIDRARRLWCAALDQARQSKQPFTLPFGLTMSVMAQLSVDDFDTALQGADELIAHSNEHSVSFFWGIGSIFRGRCLVARGEVEAGLEQMAQGLEAYRRTHGSLWLPIQLTLIADAYGKIGEPSEGLRRLEEADLHVATAGESFAESGICRVRGELFMVLGRPDAAEESLRRALDVARRQNARLLELRAVVSLARIWRDRGNRRGAYELLAPAYHWFNEGLDTPVHREADRLLRSLVG